MDELSIGVQRQERLSSGRLTAGGQSPTLRAGTFLGRWWHSIRHASQPYWVLQTINSVGSVFITVQVLQSAAQFGGAQRSFALLGAASDAVVLLLLTHVLVRPLLQVGFVRNRATLLTWVGLMVALMACAALSVCFTDLVTMLSGARGPIQEIRFHTGTSEFGITLSGWQLFAMQVINALMAYVLWAAVYLGWKAIAARRELQRKVNHARLWQLTRQMGPHFLFNAFNSIRGLMYEDIDRASQLITRLSDLLRVQLGMHEDTHQSLRDECRMARDYLEIELVRLEPRLSYSFHIAADCEAFLLPTLTVLTAVENAVKHGIAPNAAPGWVRVEARRSGRHWLLEITNSYDQPSSVQSTGIGLKNLRERLLLSSNGLARLAHQRESDLFRLRMELPA